MSVPAENIVSYYQAAAKLGRRENVRRWIVSLAFGVYWLLIFEGALRKWGVPQLEQALFFIRVPIALLIYWIALYYRRWPRLTAPMFAVYILAIAVTMLIPLQFAIGGYSERHLLIAGYGWFNYFFYIPLAFLIAEQFRREDLWRLIRHTVWIALAAAPVVMWQFYSSPDSIINMGAGQDEAHQFQGLHAGQNIIRPSGFFTSSLGQQMFVAGTTALVLAALLYPKSMRQLSPKLLWLGIAATAVMLLYSQSRGLFLSIGLIVMAAAFAGMFTGRKQVVLRTIVWLAVLSVVGAVLWPILFPDAFEAFVGRWTSAWQKEIRIFQFGIFGRALYMLYSFIQYIPETPVFGYLIGIGGNAAGQLEWVRLPQAASEWQGYGAWAEFAWDRHIIELGPPLGIMFILFRIGLTVWLALYALRATRLSGDPLPLTLFSYTGLALLLRQITGQGTVNGFTWFFVGLCLAASRVALSEIRNMQNAPNILRMHRHA